MGAPTGVVASVFLGILGNLDPTENPYPTLEAILRSAFYPTSSESFRIHCYVLVGIFSASVLVVLAALALRIAQGRFWLVRRVHGSLLMPNASVCFGLFALVYLSLGISNLFTAVSVSRGSAYPDHYLVLQGLLPGALWFGIYTELWATLGSIIYRKRGDERHSSSKQWLVALVPVLLALAVSATEGVLLGLAQKHFNEAVDDYETIVAYFEARSAIWTPVLGLDLEYLAGVIPAGTMLLDDLLEYSEFAASAYYVGAAVFAVTGIFYLASTINETFYLRRQARALRGKAPLPDDTRISGPIDAGSYDIEKDLNDEFSGVGRLASLLSWAASNRQWTGRFIVLMVLSNIGLSLWFALKPISFPNNGIQFQTIILVSSYINGVLLACVSLLILFRSLDGSSASTRRMRILLPFLPLPPAVGLQGGTATVFHQDVDIDREMPPTPLFPVRWANPELDKD